MLTESKYVHKGCCFLKHSWYPAGFYTQDTSDRWGSYQLVDSRCCEPPSGSCSQSSGSSSCILPPPAWCCCHTSDRSCSGCARPTLLEPEPQLLQDEEREQIWGRIKSVVLVKTRERCLWNRKRYCIFLTGLFLVEFQQVSVGCLWEGAVLLSAAFKKFSSIFICCDGKPSRGLQDTLLCLRGGGGRLGLFPLLHS